MPGSFACLTISSVSALRKKGKPFGFAFFALFFPVKETNTQQVFGKRAVQRYDQRSVFVNGFTVHLQHVVKLGEAGGTAVGVVVDLGGQSVAFALEHLRLGFGFA